METVSFTMIDGAAKAENAGNLIKNVWYNAIYEERNSETDQYTMKNGKFVDDFNDAETAWTSWDDKLDSDVMTKIVDEQQQLAQGIIKPDEFIKTCDSLVKK